MENTTCLIYDSTDNLYDSTNNFLRSFFICCGVLITGSTFALIVTARLLFQEVRKESHPRERDDRSQTGRYGP